MFLRYILRPKNMYIIKTTHNPTIVFLTIFKSLHYVWSIIIFLEHLNLVIIYEFTIILLYMNLLLNECMLIFG